MNKIFLFFLLFLSTKVIMATDIKIMSYNIHIGNPPSMSEEYRDLSAIATVINNEKPDLVGLQEVDRNTTRSGGVDQIGVLASATGMYHYYVKTRNFSGGEYGIGILSKYPIIDSYNYLLPKASDGSGEDRVIAIISVMIEGRKMYFANTHFDHLLEETRLLQAGRVLEIMNEAPFVNQPFILTGDLNDKPNTSPVTKLSEGLTMARSIFPYTFSAASPNRTIDYIMFSTTMLTDYYVSDYRVVNETYASDHLPLVAKLSTYVDNLKDWKYNFGTQVGNLSPKSAAGILSSNDGISGHAHGLLPTPDDGQLARVWTGSNNVEGYTLTSSGPIGSGSKLFFKAPPTASTSKFSMLNIGGTGIMSVGFTVKFDAGTNADYRFAIGSDASTMSWIADNTYALPVTTSPATATQFSNNINFNDSNLTPTILLMQWRLSSSGYKLMIKENKSSDNNVSFSGFWELNKTLNPSISFVNGGVYNIQVYANNSPVDKTYIKDNGVQTVKPRSCHIWINNTLLLYTAGNPNFKDEGTSLTAGDILNAFMFLGYNNTGNNAQMYLDDFTYANYLTDITTLPVILDGFYATKQNNSIVLNWKTLSEKNNARFEILRAGDKNENFKLIKTVTRKGTASATATYSVIDNSPLLGNNYYKLVQIDHNGQADTLAVASAKISLDNSNFNVYIEKGNSLKLSVNSSQQENAVFEIYNIEGQRLITQNTELKEGNNQLLIPVKLLRGVYVAILRIDKNQITAKFICN